MRLDRRHSSRPAACRQGTVAPSRQTTQCGAEVVLMRAPVLNMEALAALAPRLAPDASGVGEARAISGGASQELWAVSIDTPAGPRRLVLRRAPEGRVASGLSIPIEAEARVMRLAH